MSDKITPLLQPTFYYREALKSASCSELREHLGLLILEYEALVKKVSNVGLDISPSYITQGMRQDIDSIGSCCEEAQDRYGAKEASCHEA